MAIVLLDTSVGSLLLPQRTARPERALYEPYMLGNTLALSFQSAAELWKLAEKRRWADRRRAELEAFVRKFLVIPYDYELARIWARICVEAETEGRPFETGDAWIAATAVYRRLTLLAHDRDFKGRSIAGLTLICLLPDSIR
jgi:tRNA(fMet)-specific endonuclease VapC